MGMVAEVRPSSVQAKSLLFVSKPTETHWVGDGFLVSSLVLPNSRFFPFADPFLMLDYAAPRSFAASSQQRGVGEHPHRGFETVTFAIQGEIAHRDSGGGGGTIGTGGCQWMTAGRGVVHEELFSEAFSNAGGLFEMVQVWVNLPARHKMTEPKYQGFAAKDIPVVELSDGIRVRVFAGELAGVRGPCETHTPIHVYDVLASTGAVNSPSDRLTRLAVPKGSNTLVLVLRGCVDVGQNEIQAGELGFLSRDEELVEMVLKGAEARCLVLAGVPIGEPFAAYGPFVMNTREEIEQAMADYRDGKMGRL